MTPAAPHRPAPPRRHRRQFARALPRQQRRRALGRGPRAGARRGPPRSRPRCSRWSRRARCAARGRAPRCSATARPCCSCPSFARSTSAAGRASPRRRSRRSDPVLYRTWRENARRLRVPGRRAARGVPRARRAGARRARAHGRRERARRRAPRRDPRAREHLLGAPLAVPPELGEIVSFTRDGERWFLGPPQQQSAGARRGGLSSRCASEREDATARVEPSERTGDAEALRAARRSEHARSADRRRIA